MPKNNGGVINNLDFSQIDYKEHILQLTDVAMEVSCGKGALV